MYFVIPNSDTFISPGLFKMNLNALDRHSRAQRHLQFLILYNKWHTIM
jgi:hypothetical protein